MHKLHLIKLSPTWPQLLKTVITPLSSPIKMIFAIILAPWLHIWALRIRAETLRTVAEVRRAAINCAAGGMQHRRFRYKWSSPNTMDFA